MKIKKIIHCLNLFLLLIFSAQTFASDSPVLQPPPTLVAEHEALKQELQEAIQSGGKTGQAAQVVAALVMPHMKNQMEFVYPPLGLLPILASGTVTPDMAAALPMIQKVKENYSQLLSIHAAIIAQENNLIAAAKAENKQQFVDLGNRLKLFAKAEEDILYPTDILIGEFIKLKLNIKS